MPLLPPIRALPDAELLRMLLGDSADLLPPDRRLSHLFDLWPPSCPTRAACEAKTPYGPWPALTAAKELMARALEETLQAGDCLSDPQAVKDLLRLRLGGLPHEVFVVLLLDSQNRLIAFVELFRGTLTQTSVYPREVVKLTMECNAAAVIFAHNHPSGSLTASRADEVLTMTLKQSLALVDVTVLDHFIVAGSADPLSFAERGLL